ncbi:MAG TPA: sugar transferase [Acidobacteriaceae bacterium]|nr:sugar transferase [Acidobacteriaceae bacterium]
MATPEIVTADLSYKEENFRAAGFADPTFEAAMRGLPVASFQYNMVKPVLDLVLVLLALPIALPLGLLVALAVRLTSGGSVLYRHRRIGQYQKPLDVWKFRTMYEDSDTLLDEHLSADAEARDEWVRTQKLRDDPRVTPIGRLLRKTSLDEIPQLLNVLAGDMSLVGPRPIVDEERAKYGQYFRTYTYALPGITGLWQVSGRCDVDYAERVQMDVQYVEQWSLWMELKILLKTFKVILHSKGAY